MTLCGKWLTVLVVIVCVESIDITLGQSTSCNFLNSAGLTVYVVDILTQDQASNCSCFNSSRLTIGGACGTITCGPDMQIVCRLCKTMENPCCSDSACSTSNNSDNNQVINVTCNCESVTTEPTSVTTTPNPSSVTNMTTSSDLTGVIIGVVVGVGGGIIFIVVIVIVIILLRRRRSNFISNSTRPGNSTPSKTVNYYEDACRVTSVYPSPYDNLESPPGETNKHNARSGISQENMENDYAKYQSTSDPHINASAPPMGYDNLCVSPAIRDSHETTLLDNQLYGQRSASKSTS